MLFFNWHNINYNKLNSQQCCHRAGAGVTANMSSLVSSMLSRSEHLVSALWLHGVRYKTVGTGGLITAVITV